MNMKGIEDATQPFESDFPDIDVWDNADGLLNKTFEIHDYIDKPADPSKGINYAGRTYKLKIDGKFFSFWTTKSALINRRINKDDLPVQAKGVMETSKKPGPGYGKPYMDFKNP